MASPLTQLERAIAETFGPLVASEREKHINAVLRAIDEAGRPNRDAFRGILPPEKLVWTSSEIGGYQPTAQAGQTVLALARAETAPTSGACVITLAWESAAQGLTTLGTVRIPSGQRFGQSGVTEIGAMLPAGAWVRATIGPASGAGNVSVALVLKR